MYRYAIVFKKTGYVKYISHLDLQRLFKGALRRTGVCLSYTHGFNPHPKMSLAQPLSLGYSSDGELLEIETDKAYDKSVLIGKLNKELPNGVESIAVGRITNPQIGKAKTLAASVKSAKYDIIYPISLEKMSSKIDDFLNQEKIIVMKKQKKDHMREIDIKDKIKKMSISASSRNYNSFIDSINCELDCGSASYLSPEYLINSFNSFVGINVPRYEIEVNRISLQIPVDFPIKWL